MILTLWLAPLAFGQQVEVPEVNAQLYRPVVDSPATLWTDSSGHITDRGELKGRLALHYANRPLVFLEQDASEPTSLVSDVLQLDAAGVVAVDRFRFAVDLPVYLFSAGAVTDDGPGLGELAVDTRVTLLDRIEGPLGLAVTTRVTLPTTTVPAPLGNPALVGELALVADRDFTERLMVAANLGMRFGPTNALQNVVIDDAFVWRVGGGYALRDDTAIGLSADIVGFAQVRGAPAGAAGAPVEALAGGWGRIGDDLVFRGGLGRGLTPGIGSANARVVTMMCYEPGRARDADGDGLADDVDRCPNEAEDVDSFHDDDGCVDPDNDGDNIADGDDACPTEAEDHDGYDDDDGCPDPSIGIAVEITDPKGEEIPGVRAIITGPQHPVQVQGRIFLAALHEGRYNLTAAADGFVSGSLDFEVPLIGDQVMLVLQPLD